MPAAAALAVNWRGGVLVQGRRTLPCEARLLEPQPEMAARTPPIRVRKNIPTAWIELELVEGKNRQVRRMTASVGHPTLRLLRVRIGNFELGDLTAGKWHGTFGGGSGALLVLGDCDFIAEGTERGKNKFLSHGWNME